MPAAHSDSSPDQLAEALRLLPRTQHGHAAVTRRALPFVLLAQHVVGSDGVILLRVPSGQIEAELLDGTVVAYHTHPRGEWADEAPGVQLIGPVTVVRLGAAERRAFHAATGRPQGDPAGTCYVRLTPRLAAPRPRTAPF